MAARGREGERMEYRHLSQEPLLLPVNNLQHSFIIYQTKHYSSQEKKKKTISDIQNIIRLQQTSLPATGSMDQSNTVLPLVFGPGFWLTAS
ncbi:hypothetical protein DY000_02013209 [Brassica cretica]|uniref:Uncharacterized protein n=1 Tax=Brassica cretica TaxID=69181 RepID=A0ABQ7CWU4_BRACR|nr:hypothetical protein DY000_02013209 [Brassica cretica]